MSAIDRQHSKQLGPLEQRRARHVKRLVGEAARDQNAHHEPDRFRHHGGRRSTGDPPIKTKHQRQRQDHIDEIDGDLNGERKPRVGLPDQPAEHDVIGKGERRGPDSYPEIDPRGARHALAAAHGIEQDRSERRLQHDEGAADQRGDDETAHQQRANFLFVDGAERLRGEGDRAHAQKGKQPEQAVENHRCDRYTAEQRCVAEPPDRNRRYDADQWRRQVRDHRGSRDGENLCGRNPGGGGRRGRIAIRSRLGASSMISAQMPVALSPARRGEYPGQEPDRNDDDGAKQEIAP